MNNKRRAKEVALMVGQLIALMTCSYIALRLVSDLAWWLARHGYVLPFLR